MSDLNLDWLPQRKSIRLKDYDYTRSSAYFITLATYQRRRILSRVVNSGIDLLDLGQIVKAEWLLLPSIRPFAAVSEEFLIVMPDHIHAVVWLEHHQDIMSGLHRELSVNNHPSGYRPMSLSSVVAGFKSRVTVKWRRLTGDKNANVWQRNYYETVIRGPKHLERVREYILDNPRRWAERRS